MPDDMPREDYSTPAMYTFNMLAKILRYLLYGTLGVTAAGLAGVEGGHQYVENVMMAYPSHVDSRNTDPSSEEAVYAWAEDNDAWTGGSSGGTSSALGFYARHTLRSAWLAREYGVGSSGAAAIGRAGQDSDSGQMKGMIGAGKSGTEGDSLNTSDPSSIMAEDYLARTILAARSKGIAFPGNLPGNRETYPPVSPSSSHAQVPVDRVALDLLTRHAEVLERIAKPSSLRQAEETYEILLRSVLDRSVANSVEEVVKQAELLQLAKKLGDVNIRLGDAERATGWWEWGMRFGGLATRRPSSQAMPVTEHGVTVAETRGWLPRWLGSNSGSASAGAIGSRMEHTLAQNSHMVVPQDTTINHALPNLHPLIRRAAISLISSYASNLGMQGQLVEAGALQNMGLQLAKATDSTKESTPAASLQNLWLNHRASLLTLNAVEVAHAQGEDIQVGLGRLAEATKQAEEVIRNIAAAYSTSTRPVIAADGQPAQYTPSRAIPMRNMEIADRFGKNQRKSPLARPASQLLRDAERTAAEGWNLTGLLYEKLARLPVHQAMQRQALHEVALDCHERAMGWSTIASGGEADGLNQIAVDEDALGLGGKGGVGKTTEYWRNYMRVRAKLEAQVTAV